jgi:integrase
MRELIDVMAEFGWNRRYLNDQISRIKQIFKWGVSRELVDQDVYFRLRTVDSVRRGEISNLREASEVQQIADDIIDATVPHLSDTVGAMVQIQRLTACRPGELVIMRPADIDRTNDIWRYTPGKHKTQHHDKKRVIAIGPKAQAKLAPFLLRLPDVYCFPTRRKGKYTTDSYRRAIHRACDRAFPAADHLSEDERLAWQSEHRWSPHRLRHTAGYALREEFGLEHVQVTLGHSQARTSEVYAPPIEAKQLEAAAKLG